MGHVVLETKELGIRAVDAYVFEDDRSWLGNWHPDHGHDFVRGVALSNRDFHRFQAEYMPVFNIEACRQGAQPLACQDYWLVTPLHTVPFEVSIRYPIFALGLSGWRGSRVTCESLQATPALGPPTTST